MQLIKTFDFNRALDKLPKSIQTLFHIQEERFILNRDDQRLHIKKLKKFDKDFSFRITRRYRAVFYYRNPDTAVCYDIGHRKDVYR